VRFLPIGERGVVLNGQANHGDEGGLIPLAVNIKPLRAGAVSELFRVGLHRVPVPVFDVHGTSIPRSSVVVNGAVSLGHNRPAGHIPAHNSLHNPSRPAIRLAMDWLITQLRDLWHIYIIVLVLASMAENGRRKRLQKRREQRIEDEWARRRAAL
jgi:hypothetical protein